MEGVQAHHLKKEVCYKRPIYREARWERAIKVYTINQESKYLLVQGIPQVGANKELIELFSLYGEVEDSRLLDNYPTEKFTEVYWIKYKRIQSARFAKKKLDNQSFFGGLLHVCYAPEYESKKDTKEKLLERQRAVLKKCKEYNDEWKKNSSKLVEDSSTDQSKLKNISAKKLTTTLPNASMIDTKSLPSIPIDLNPIIPQPSSFSTYLFSTNSCQQDLPRVPSKQATLPEDLKYLSAVEVYPKYFENITHITDEERNHIMKDKSEKGNTSIQSASADETVCKKKAIVWNPKFSEHMNKNSSTYTYSKSPGAWDPYKESHIKSCERLLNDNTGDEYNNVVHNIRNRLNTTMEPNIQPLSELTECPLLIITKSESRCELTEKDHSQNLTRKRNANRKRI
ncbi:uncharacterized protein LOC100209751 isoform X1 [Hydra vulgaris]|uniref:uncharacterized protein LOC100209751 isoform X1 n=1 Tax=Hydra vulgaris TaxID=6087 RepID=UPI001F5F95EB|nr:uncharacterized protein LOC100209751 isoform X1 [Hydra vulgaris]